MTAQKCPVVFIIIQFFIGQTLGECAQRNISCDDIKTANGFKFKHHCPGGSEISVFDNNETTIAHFVPSKQVFHHLTEVMNMVNGSVTTKNCQYLKVQCIIVEKSFIKEICMDFIITGKATRHEEVKDPEPKDLWIIFSVCVIIGIIGFGMLCWCCISWKNGLKKQHGVASLPGFFGYLLTCSCLRKRISLAESGERQETRHSEGREVQGVTAGDLEAQHNGDIRNETPSDGDPRGSGENDTEQDDTLGSVCVPSIDSKADGKTPQSVSLDRSLSNERVMPTKNGDIIALNRISSHRAMNRYMRDDPGGANSNNRRDTMREMDNGWAVGGHDAEDHVTEGRPLLPAQRAAIQDFDMTGEAIALVNKPDPDRLSRCSTAPDTDVESTPNIKNYE